MRRPRKTLDELIGEAVERQERSRTDLADLRTRARILERKRDAHRKIVTGAILLLPPRPFKAWVDGSSPSALNR